MIFGGKLGCDHASTARAADTGAGTQTHKITIVVPALIMLQQNAEWNSKEIAVAAAIATTSRKGEGETSPANLTPSHANDEAPAGLLKFTT